ncbi:MAG: hypothetical protein JWR42_2885 [Marmoricola sp.]|nr:hypothetical protein [Marmoricola sp.]
MRRARLVLAVGLLLWVLGFAVGTEPRTATVGAHDVSCGTPLPVSWLVPGATAQVPGAGATSRERRACASEVTRGRWLAGAALGVGALLGLIGWTATRELRPRPSTRPRTA